MDILGLGMADGAELRVHPTGKAVVRISVQSQGQGHETTFAQIVSEITGIPSDDIDVVHGDTDNTPFGLGTYGSRSTPVSGAAVAVAAKRVVDKAKIIAGAMMEVSPDDIEVEKGTFSVKGDPTMSKTIQEIALAAHGPMELPEGVEGHLDAACVYDPPNLTYPYGAYICVVGVDPNTGVVKVRRFIAVDDCGTRINPMIVEGQIHGGLADGIGMALMEVIAFDEDGNCLGGSFLWITNCPRRWNARAGNSDRRDPLASPSDRSEGCWRVGHGRFAGRRSQRGDGRAEAVRRTSCGHALDASSGVAHDPGPPVPRPIWRSPTEVVLT